MCEIFTRTLICANANALPLRPLYAKYNKFDGKVSLKIDLIEVSQIHFCFWSRARTRRDTDTYAQRHRRVETQTRRDTDAQRHRRVETQTKTQTRRNTDTDTDAQRQTQTQRRRDTDTDRRVETQTQTRRDTETDTDAQRHRHTHTNPHTLCARARIDTHVQTAGGSYQSFSPKGGSSYQSYRSHPIFNVFPRIISQQIIFRPIQIRVQNFS